MNSFKHLLLSALVGAAAAGAVALDERPGRAATGEVDCLIPFDGELYLDGVGFNGAADLRFTLYDEAGTSYGWTEEHAAVPVRQGRFKVLLGLENTALATIIADASEIQVAVEVRSSTGSGSYVALGDRQVLGISPWSLSASSAADMSVAGALTASGAAELSQLLSVSGDIFLSDANALVSIGAGGGDATVVFGDSDDHGATMTWSESADTLTFRQGQSGDGTELMSIDASGNLVAAGAATLGDDSELNITSVGGTGECQGDLTIGPSGSASLSVGVGESTRAGIVFSDTDSTSGFQIVYDPTGDDIIFESGGAVTEGADILTVDGSLVSVARNLVLTDYLGSGVDTVAASQIDSSADRWFGSDSSCTNGALRLTVVSTKPAICGCFTGVGNAGWYCWL